MTTRITLISSGATAATRNATFPADEPLEQQESVKAAALIPALPSVDRTFCSPDRASRQTAEALGLAAIAEPDWREVDFGRWAGKSLAAIQEEDPAALAAWIHDPDSSPPDGESVAGLIRRIGRWLDLQFALPGRLLIIAPPNCLRAAVVHSLQAPAASFRHIDVMPLTVTYLSGRQGQWRLRLGGRSRAD
ncbi:MAG TPA: histidine phosphatase family protein [Dongiaceae bacterium]|nr:histidine phosphatase family protein [Dongiaceae bacterium]